MGRLIFEGSWGGNGFLFELLGSRLCFPKYGRIELTDIRKRGAIVIDLVWLWSKELKLRGNELIKDTIYMDTCVENTNDIVPSCLVGLRSIVIAE